MLDLLARYWKLPASHSAARTQGWRGPSSLSKTCKNFNFHAKGDAFSHRAAGATVLILGKPSAPASWPDQLRLQTDVILASPLPGATSGQSEFPLGAETR